MNNRKYLVMGGSIVGIIIVLLVSMIILSSCVGKKDYKNIEDKLVSAAKNYIQDGREEVPDGSKLVIYDQTLSLEGYIKPMEELTNDSCSGTVYVMNNGGQMNYLSYLDCSNYVTETAKNVILSENLTNSGDGLYSLNGEYIFRGKNPNNHLRFLGEDWLIIKINANGDLKLVNITQSNQAVAWDSKFNEDTSYTSGENLYAVSDIHEYLTNLYDGFKDTAKQRLIPYDVCTGTRDGMNLTISNTIDCATTLSGEYIGLLNPSDYAYASYDKDCTDILKGSCINYNYIYQNIDETWTPNALSDSTYEAILYSSGRFSATTTRENHKYFIVVYINGNEKIVSGDGSETDPYVIK